MAFRHRRLRGIAASRGNASTRLKTALAGLAGRPGGSDRAKSGTVGQPGDRAVTSRQPGAITERRPFIARRVETAFWRWRRNPATEAAFIKADRGVVWPYALGPMWYLKAPLYVGAPAACPTGAFFWAQLPRRKYPQTPSFRACFTTSFQVARLAPFLSLQAARVLSPGSDGWQGPCMQQGGRIGRLSLAALAVPIHCGRYSPAYGLL